MKKNILIDMECIIPPLDDTTIHSHAISSIVLLAKGLGNNISLQYGQHSPSIPKGIIESILASEGIQTEAPYSEPDIYISSAHRADSAADLSIVFDPVDNDWRKIVEVINTQSRRITHIRNTKETQIAITINLDGTGQGAISTGLHFFDHMLDQLARHGGMDLTIQAQGDLHIDEHHTIEDTAITLGEAFALALGDKRGIERYGFCLPMDDALAQVAVDFGGRSWLVWDAVFKREKIGDMPTEMFYHFFKSFCDGARCNLNIRVEGENEHHKIESIFKAFARAIRMAVKRDLGNMQLPSTKGVL